MPFWWKRYEPILEAKPVAGSVAVKELIAKELVELFETFPPAEGDLEWEDPALERKLKGHLHELPRLDTPMVTLLAKIIALDLQHEVDAVDHLFRNDHHREAASTQRHVDALHLLWRAVIEHLEQRKEDSRGILKRADLVDIIEDARARFSRRRQAEA